MKTYINFININIGTSTYRLKEIGLRKVFGGEKKQLVLQYLTEAMLLTLFAGLLLLAALAARSERKRHQRQCRRGPHAYSGIQGS